VGGCGLDLSQNMGGGGVMNSGEHGNGPSGSAEGGEFLGCPSDISSQVRLCFMKLVAGTVS
jgi:hypothetical protein